MSSRRWTPPICAAVLLLGTCTARAGSRSLEATSGAPPTGFSANVGQIAGPARYYAAGPGAAVFFEPDAIVLRDEPASAGLPDAVIRVEFPSAPARPRLEAVEPTEPSVHVYAGSDRRSWRTGLRSYREVRYLEIAPATDLVYRIERDRLKYDLVLHPGADLAKTRLRYRGADRLEVAGDGGLRVLTRGGMLREEAPHLYQERNGERIPVVGGFRVLSGDTFGFWAEGYDADRDLVVDPGMAWSTFLGGSSHDYPFRVATDSNGDLYVVGYTESPDYPVLAAYQASKALTRDVFVTKLRGDGSGILWSTFLGGSDIDQALAVAVDANNAVYVAGNTSSVDFPVTSGAFRRTASGAGDAFVAKLSAQGALVYSTYLGGGSIDIANAIGVDASGSVTVAGMTASLDFPVTAGVLKTTLQDAQDGFVTKLNASGSQLVFSTFLGAAGTDQITDLALDGQGRATVVGMTTSTTFPVTAGVFDPAPDALWDGFVARLNSTGTGFVFSTYLSGSGYDEPWGVANDATGNAYVVGRTASPNFQTTTGAYQRAMGGGTYDGFAVKISPDARTLMYSTFLGGSGNEGIYKVAVNGSGEALLVGYTESTNFPVTADAFDATANGASDAFVCRLGASGGSLAYSTYLGGGAADYGRSIAPKSGGQVAVAGYTVSTSFPVTPGAFDPTFNGTSSYQEGFVSTLTVGGSSVAVDDASGGASFQLTSPYPSPFSDRTRFSLVLPADASVTVRVLDVRGRLVQQLADGTLTAGRHELAWDGRDRFGNDVGPGVYFVDAVTATGRTSRRIVRMK